MRLTFSSNTRSANDADVRLEWRRTSSGVEMDEVLVRVDGSTVTPQQLTAMGAKIADASPLERKLLRRGGYAALID